MFTRLNELKSFIFLNYLWIQDFLIIRTSKKNICNRNNYKEKRSEVIYLKTEIEFQLRKETFSQHCLIKMMNDPIYLFLDFSGNYRKNYIPLDVVHWKRCRAVGDRSLRIHPSQVWYIRRYLNYFIYFV